MTATATPEDFLSPLGSSRFILAAAIAFSTFQIITAAFSPISSSIVRAVHVGFLLLLIFCSTRTTSAPLRVGSWALGIIGFVLAFYHWVFEGDLIERAGGPTDLDIVIGVTTIVLVFEGARRVMGFALPFICAMFVAYALFGNYLPGDFAHRGFAFEQ